MGRGRDVQPRPSPAAREAAGAGRQGRAAGVRSRARGPAAQSGAAAVAGAPGRGLPRRQRVGHAHPPLLCRRHRDGEGAAVDDGAGFRPGDGGRARPAAAGGGKKSSAPSRLGAELLPLLNWVDQLSRPANDILENVMAEGAKLLEGGIHKLFHPDQAAAMARQAGSLIGEFARVLALPDDPATPLRGSLSGQQARRLGRADPVGRGESRRPRARLHGQRRADGDGGRRARRSPARAGLRHRRGSRSALRCR